MQCLLEARLVWKHHLESFPPYRCRKLQSDYSAEEASTSASGTLQNNSRRTHKVAYLGQHAPRPGWPGAYCSTPEIAQHHLLANAKRDTPILLGGDFNDVWGRLGQKYLNP